MAIKKLPITIKPLITSECWTFYKMAIIQSWPYFDMWLASHLKIYTDDTGETLYGEYGKMYQMSYFSEALNICEERISDKAPDEIIDFIIKSIDDGKYIIIDVLLDDLHNSQASSVHETLVYGYDSDTKEFFVPLLINNVFQEQRVSFKDVQLSYAKVRKFYLEHDYKLYTRRKFFYGITILSPKEMYINDNAGYEFIAKLRAEYMGAIYKEQVILDIHGENKEHIYYTGISCIRLLAKEIIDNIETINDTLINKYKISCLKICENACIILRSLKWFANLYAKNINDFDNLIEEYEMCYNLIYNCVLLFHKYAITGDTKILLKISEKLMYVYKIEQVLIKQIISSLAKTYADVLKGKIK